MYPECETIRPPYHYPNFSSAIIQSARQKQTNKLIIRLANFIQIYWRIIMGSCLQLVRVFATHLNVHLHIVQPATERVCIASICRISHIEIYLLSSSWDIQPNTSHRVLSDCKRSGSTGLSFQWWWHGVSLMSADEFQCFHAQLWSLFTKWCMYIYIYIYTYTC